MGRLARAAVPAAVLGLSLVAPGAAQAAFSVSVSAQPAATTAGAHKDFTLQLDFTGGSPKDLDVHLPPGLLGNPRATPILCTQSEFQGNSCPAQSQVGTTVVTAAPVLLPVTASGAVYNVEPPADRPAPAQLGVVVQFAGLPVTAIPVEIRTRLGDYGLDSRIRDVPSLGISSMSLTLNGDVAGGGKFMTNPTSCAPATTVVDVTPQSGTPASAQDTFTPTGCDQLPFTPSLEVGPKQPHADTPGEASATLLVPGGDDPSGRVQAHVHRVELALPDGLVLSPGLANGLEACTPEQFGLTEDRTPDCPAASEIGDVTFETPFFAAPLTGKVYFGTPTPTAKLRNFVSVEDPRLRVKLVGDVRVDPATGRVTNVFADSPQVPFTKFIFRYKDGPTAVLTAPQTCATFAAQATMTPWSGTAPQAPTDTFTTIDCPPPLFTPGLGADVSDTTAGGDMALTVHITRPDRQLRLLRSTVSLPPGLLGRLGSVPGCPVEDARRAACSEDSRVGSAAVTVGTGSAPLTLPARVYLTQGYDGAVAGLAIVVPAKVGPIDLGTVVTLAQLRLRPSDAGIDVVTEDLPQIVDGIPTAYRSIDLTIDRPGFLVNATSCAPQQLHGTLTAVGGATAVADAPYQATGCGDQPYAPRFSATLGAPGATKARSHIPLVTTIRQAPGEANSRSVVVTLPPSVSADPRALAGACAQDLLAAGRCPAAAKVGTIQATSSLLPFPLNGTILLVRPVNGPLPELSLELPLGIRLRATVGIKNGRLETVFPAVPDVPLNRLVVAFDGGPNSVLVAARDLCRGTHAFGTSFTSHGGVTRTGTVAAQVPCKPTLTARVALKGVAKRRPALTMTVTAGGTKLRELRIALPRQLRAAAAQALRKRARVSVDGRRLRSATVRTSKGRLVVAGLPQAGASRVALVLAPGALGQRGRLRPGARLAFRVEGRPVRGRMLAVKTRTKARR